MFAKEQRTALVTGAARGIGLASAQRLRRQGCKVVGVDIATDAMQAVIEHFDDVDTVDISDGSAVEALRDRAYALKANARQVSDVVASQTALATGEVDILIGGGEWVTALLSAENPALDWTVPSQGALRWSQSIAVLEDSGNKDMATEFVKYIVSPEGQARLATSSCYWGMPANRAAGDVLTDDQKAALRWDDQDEYLANTQLYPTPDADLDLAMQDLWTDMLQQ